MYINKDSALLLKRVVSTDNSTLGVFYIDKTPAFFVIEDEYRENKVSGETRIPEGVYTIKLRKDLTTLTQRYRDKYPWFIWHIEITNVPNFTGIYMHIGNTEEDTAGCQLVGYHASIQSKEFINMTSTDCYKELYSLLYPILEREGEIQYTIIDLDF